MSVNDDKDLSFCLSTCGPISNKCKGRTLMIYAILLLVDDATKYLFRTVVRGISINSCDLSIHCGYCSYRVL